MRAVALSDKTVQQKVADSFIPLKVEIPYGTPEFPLDWPALKVWKDAYVSMGGPKTTGLTTCSVVSPDLQTEYGSTGSAFVWEMFDSIAYDADKFAAMLDAATARAKEERRILTDTSLDEPSKLKSLTEFRKQVKKDVTHEGRFRFPPEGFTIEGATKLFEMTGDVAWLEAQKAAEAKKKSDNKSDGRK